MPLQVLLLCHHKLMIIWEAIEPEMVICTFIRVMIIPINS